MALNNNYTQTCLHNNHLRKANFNSRWTLYNQYFVSLNLVII